MTPNDIAKALHDIELEPGDLILTGRRDPISRVIQAFTRSPVSHVVVSLGGTRCVHAMDNPWAVDEAGGGVYRLTTDDIANWPTLTTIILVRPDRIDHQRVEDAAHHYLANSPPFATTGLALTGMLVLLNHPAGWSIAQASIGRRRLLQVLDRYTDIITDGAHRIMCAELAYRLLTRAGHNIELIEPTLHHRLARYVATNRQHELTRTFRLDPRSRRSIARTQHWRRQAAPLPTQPVAPTLDTLYTAWNELKSAVSRRTLEDTPGDIADLVLPVDLLHAQPFTQLTAIATASNGTRTGRR